MLKEGSELNRENNETNNRTYTENKNYFAFA